MLLKRLKCRWLPAAEQSLGVHEGPQQLALRADADPYTAALVPPPATPPPSGEVIYSKGAALVASLESYMERFAPGSFQVMNRGCLVTWSVFILLTAKQLVGQRQEMSRCCI